MIRRNHAAKTAKDRRPHNDDRRLDQNIPLDDQRASLVAQQITEADSVNILSLQVQISLLDARKAEDELLASRVPDLEVIIIDGNGNCFWSALSVFLDSAGLPPESPESIMKGTADVLKAVNTNDDQCKSPCYFSLSWCVRADLIWLGCLGTDEICQDHAKKIGDYISHGEHVVLAAAFYANITIKAGEPMEFCPEASATWLGFEPKGEPDAVCTLVRRVAAPMHWNLAVSPNCDWGASNIAAAQEAEAKKTREAKAAKVKAQKEQRAKEKAEKAEKEAKEKAENAKKRAQRKAEKARTAVAAAARKNKKANHHAPAPVPADLERACFTRQTPRPPSSKGMPPRVLKVTPRVPWLIRVHWNSRSRYVWSWAHRPGHLP